MSDRNNRKTKVGVVVSNKMDKTITVAVEDFVRHSLYGKAVKRTKKFKAHDEENDMQHRRYRQNYGDETAQSKARDGDSSNIMEKVEINCERQTYT